MKRLLIVAALLLAASSLNAATICATNEDSGHIVLTLGPCVESPWLTFTDDYRAGWATEGNGKKHVGCWKGDDGNITMLFDEFAETGEKYSYNPRIFSEEACPKGM